MEKLIIFLSKNIFRRNIFMGECGKNAVYFDTKENVPFKAPKTMFINSEKAAVANSFTPILVIALIIASRFFEGSSLDIVYSEVSISVLILISLFVFIGLTVFLELSMYFNIKKAVPATTEELKTAIYSNQLASMLQKSKAGESQRTMLGLVTLIVVAVLGWCIYSDYTIFTRYDLIGSSIYIKDIIFIVGTGLAASVTVFLLWINNPVRWITAVEKYQNENEVDQES